MALRSQHPSPRQPTDLLRALRLIDSCGPVLRSRRLQKPSSGVSCFVCSRCFVLKFPHSVDTDRDGWVHINYEQFMSVSSACWSGMFLSDVDMQIVLSAP